MIKAAVVEEIVLIKQGWDANRALRSVDLSIYTQKHVYKLIIGVKNKRNLNRATTALGKEGLFGSFEHSLAATSMVIDATEGVHFWLSLILLSVCPASY